MDSDHLAKWLELNERDITDFEARMRERAFTYSPGDRVEFHGEVFEVMELVREDMPGYWLRDPKSEKLFLPLDLEKHLALVVH